MKPGHHGPLLILIFVTISTQHFTIKPPLNFVFSVM